MLKVKTDDSKVKIEMSGCIFENLSDTEATIKYITTTIKKECKKHGCMELYNLWLGNTIENILDV